MNRMNLSTTTAPHGLGQSGWSPELHRDFVYPCSGKGCSDYLAQGAVADACRTVDRPEGWEFGCEFLSTVGKERVTRNPGFMTFRSNVAPCRSATALTKLRPRPLPGV